MSCYRFWQLLPSTRPRPPELPPAPPTSELRLATVSPEELATASVEQLRKLLAEFRRLPLGEPLPVAGNALLARIGASKRPMSCWVKDEEMQTPAVGQVTELVRAFLIALPEEERVPPRAEPAAVVHLFYGAGLKQDTTAHVTFGHETFDMYQSDVTFLHVLETPIGRAFERIGKRVGAFTHSTWAGKKRSVERPASRREMAAIIRSAIIKAWNVPRATIHSSGGGSAVIFGQPFVIVYTGELYGRPDMVAFARERADVQALLRETQ